MQFSAAVYNLGGINFGCLIIGLYFSKDPLSRVLTNV